MKGKFRQIYNQIQYIFVNSNGTLFYSVLPILICIFEWLHFNVDFICTLSKAHLSSKFLNLVWQQISCLYDNSFCAIIDLKLSDFYIELFMKWKTKKPSKIYLSLQLIITCFLVLKFRRKKAEMLIIAFKAYKGIYFLQKSNFKCLCNIVPVHKNYMVSASSFLIFRKTSLYQSICLKWNRISLTIDFFFLFIN